MRAWSMIGALALGAAGCAANRYEPPPLEAPHATVLVRVAYLDPPKALFREAVTVDGEKLAMARPDAKKASAVTRELRVPPKPTTLRFETEFFRYDSGFESRADTSYDAFPCMVATAGSDRARTTGGTCMATQRATNTEHTLTPVTEAQCTASVTLAPSAGDRLVVEYVFEGDQRCTARCTRMTQNEAGATTSEPCP